MSHGYGSSSRGVRSAMGGGASAKNFRNFFPSVQPSSGGKKNHALPKLLNQNPDAGGSDKSDSSGLDVGVCTVQGRRPYQEDQYAVCRFLKDPQGNSENTPETHYFGVFDGHAGGKCSKAICSTIPYQFCRDEAFATKLPVALKRAIQKTNEQFLEVAGRMRLNDGSTAVQIAIRGKTMTIANVGDSRAVLISGKKSITLTEDHKPSAPSEHRRIASFGGTVTYNTGIARVAGVLAVSRAFGNYTIRNLIRADPDVTQREITEQDHYLVLASDGLWDVFRAAEVADICYTYERHGVQRIADYLVQMSLTRGSMDNVTAVVVSLSRYHGRMAQAEASGSALSASGANASNAMNMNMNKAMTSSPDSKQMQLVGGMKDKNTTGGLFNSTTTPTAAASSPAASASHGHGHNQRPASSGGAGGGLGDSHDRQHSHSRPHAGGSTVAKNRPSSGYAALNSHSSSFSSRQNANTPSSNMFNTPSSGQSKEIFEADEETLHGDLNEFNKSVDFSALNNHVNGGGGKTGGVGSSQQGNSRMHQRAKGGQGGGGGEQGSGNGGRSMTTRPRSSQHPKQSNDSGGGSVSNGLFGDRNSSSNHRISSQDTGGGGGGGAGRQQYSASPSNIMKRMFSRGGGRQQQNQADNNNKQQFFSNIGDENHSSNGNGHNQSNAHEDSSSNNHNHSHNGSNHNGSNHNRPMSSHGASGGGDHGHSTPLYSSAHRRPTSGVHGSSGGGGGSSVTNGGGGIAGGGGGGGGGGMRGNRFLGYGGGSKGGGGGKTAPLMAFSGSGGQHQGQAQGHGHGGHSNSNSSGAHNSSSNGSDQHGHGYGHAQTGGGDGHGSRNAGGGGGGGSVVDRVQNMGYSRGLHSPINTRHSKK